ncbi:hypothetical protein VTO42DRAFT_7077 [Malbranchea cinnamomea]
MFGALNRLISRLDSDSPSQKSQAGVGGDNPYGFQVLRNPNPDLPLEPWFDFIVGINGHVIDDPNLFVTEVRNCAGSSVSLDIWSAKGQRTHNIVVPISPSNPSLGVALQPAPLASTQNIWHVLDVPSPQSPAYLAGLLPYSDYILGSPAGTLRGESALGELVEDHLNRTLTLWVYNSEFDVVREVEIIPSRSWGGEGALGAILGYGALHRLPVPLGEEVPEPGEVVFETKEGVETEKGQTQPAQPPPPPQGGNFLVPADVLSPPPPPKTSPSPARHGRRHRHAQAPGVSFDDYFRESEQKSRELDYVPSRNATPVPPPPKAAGPAKSPESGTSPQAENQP